MLPENHPRWSLLFKLGHYRLTTVLVCRADYPDLEAEDILAAIEYAAHQTDHVVLADAQIN